MMCLELKCVRYTCSAGVVGGLVSCQESPDRRRRRLSQAERLTAGRLAGMSLRQAEVAMDLDLVLDVCQSASTN